MKSKECIDCSRRMLEMHVKEDVQPSIEKGHELFVVRGKEFKYRSSWRSLRYGSELGQGATCFGLVEEHGSRSRLNSCQPSQSARLKLR